jgi:site-specific DNA-methyltransferase (adenine-specific)
VSGGFRPTYVHAVEAALAAGWTYRSTVVWADGELGKSTARGSVDSASSPYIYTGAEMVPLFSNGAWRREPPCPSDIDHTDWLAWTNGLWRFRGEQTPWEGHPAPFPVELPRRLIALLSFPGDVVLDPFCGSGTTALAAVRLGRRPVGFDRSAAYVESARRRTEEGGAGDGARAD